VVLTPYPDKWLGEIGLELGLYEILFSDKIGMMG
jgi:hypothetical protein